MYDHLLALKRVLDRLLGAPPDMVREIHFLREQQDDPELPSETA